MAKHLHLDWETRSDLDLVKLGLHIYARGRNTDIVCGCYAFDDGPVCAWRPGQKVPQAVTDHIESGGEVWAHSAEFEQELCNNVAIRKYGWPYIYTSQLVCTKTMAFAMALPATLAGCAVALGIKERKDLEGSRLMQQMCRPKEITDFGDYIWWDSEDKIQRLIQYCQQDVEVERAIGKKMMRLSAYERKVWELDQVINQRGISIDFDAVHSAYQIVAMEKERLDKEILKISNGQISSCSKVEQIKKFLAKEQGLGEIKSIAKAELAAMLGDPTTPDICRSILELREQAGKASTAKLEAMLTAVSQDKRIRGCFQYSGANTRRWAGRRVQFHNLKRPSLKQTEIDEIFELIKLEPEEARARIGITYGSPISVLGDCIRGFLKAPEGHDYIACDYSAIEARVLAWLANEEATLKVFHNKQCAYIAAAANIFQTPQSEVTPDRRQVGKVAVLALGYGGGVGALQAMARGYGVKMAPAAAELISRADKSQLEWAEKRYADSELGLDHAEFMASELTKMNWRLANPNIVSFWSELETAAMNAVTTPGQQFTAGPIRFICKNNFLWCRLPSSGVISYPYPRIEKIETPWGAKRDGLTYMSEDSQTKTWKRFKTFGGSLAENVTQAVARDLLADAMLRLEAKNYPVILHVHDEIVCEKKIGDGSVQEMAGLMCVLPDWAKGLPIEAGGWRNVRYKK
jgi:DNA polymerase